MNVTNIYKKLSLRPYWGDVFEVDITHEDISTKAKRIKLLDKICSLQNLRQPGAAWTQLEIERGKDRLLNCLRFDLAYSNQERMTEAKGISIRNEIMKDFVNEISFCYSNWGYSKEEDKPSGWYPLTLNTFDMGIVFFNPEKLIFVLQISED